MKKTNFKALQRVVTGDGAEAMIVSQPRKDKPCFSVVFTHPERHKIKGHYHEVPPEWMNKLFGAAA